ncbi:hypothetical protein CPB97_008205 [Podila verticillata]|nr:hypothetical protein CPB97_008205 [Podila verticillata]
MDPGSSFRGEGHSGDHGANSSNRPQPRSFSPSASVSSQFSPSTSRTTNPFLSRFDPHIESPGAHISNQRHHQHHHRPNPFESQSDHPWSSSQEPVFSSSLFSTTSPSLGGAFSGPSSFNTNFHSTFDNSRGLLDRNTSTFDPLSLPILQMPSSPPPSSHHTPLPSSSGPYTTYQPPPSRQPSGQRMSIGGGQFLEPEPASPSASTLVGSPMTPRPDGRTFSWNVQPGNPPSQLNPSRSPTFDPHRTPTLRLHSTDSRSSEDGKDRHASAARTLGSQQSRYLGQFWDHSSNNNNDWDNTSSHVSVMMDDISLESFTPSDLPPTRKEPSGLQRLYKKASMGRGGRRANYKRDGASTPQSEFGRSSNNSIITLLAQTNTMTTNSSSTTLFGSFGFKKGQNSSFGSHKGKSIDTDSLPESPQPKQTTVDMGPDGKVYMKKPKAKKFGVKGKSNKKGGDGGNGDRKALFSNERTFIHWIKFGILLGTLGLTLCNFGVVGTLAFHVGVTVLVIAMCALGYATISFHRRDRSLSRRLQGALARKQIKKEAKGAPEGPLKPTALFPDEICYYDRVGPTVLCIALLGAYCLNFYLSMTRGYSVSGGLGYFHSTFGEES